MTAGTRGWRTGVVRRPVDPHLHADHPFVDDDIFVFRLVTRVQEGCKGVALVVVCRPPQDHDHDEQEREEELPEGLVQPQLLPILQEKNKDPSQGFHLQILSFTYGQTGGQLMEIDGPEHEDQGGHDGENQSVCKVIVQRELDGVPEKEYVVELLSNTKMC